MRLTRRGEFVLVTAVLVACAAMLLGALVIGQHLKAERLGGLIPPVSSTCQEDMPCWDCTTMGNRKCGP